MAEIFCSLINGLCKREGILEGRCDTCSVNQKDIINHPYHYCKGKYESIDVMLEVFGTEAVKHFCMCNAFKYIWRNNRKNGREDIEKAVWYLKKYLELDDPDNKKTVTYGDNDIVDKEG